MNDSTLKAIEKKEERRERREGKYVLHDFSCVRFNCTIDGNISCDFFLLFVGHIVFLRYRQHDLIEVPSIF